ncbi:mechanosensitive ion channel domain-containing protein [Buchnera aphidicola]|uniref:mechanosensitive ion channel domain-containing protein n=1 Tax=Buchnera aphidicola TaxID=9 RepID=UPI003463F501
MTEPKINNIFLNFKNWMLQNQNILLHFITKICITFFIVTTGIYCFQNFINRTNQSIFQSCKKNLLKNFLLTCFKYSIIFFILICIFHKIGIRSNSIVAILGIFSLTLGFIIQGSISNLTSGILLLTLNALKIGEYVSIGKFSGSVLNVHIFYTVLKTVDGKIILIPNNKIITDIIVNYSKEPFRRNEFLIGISHNSNVKLVKKILIKIIKSDHQVIQSKDIVAELHEISPCSLNFVVRCWSKTEELNIVYWRLLKKFKVGLEKKNIEIFQLQINLMPINNLNNNINYINNNINQLKKII